jgi:hypothetical protein
MLSLDDLSSSVALLQLAIGFSMKFNGMTFIKITIWFRK